MKDKVLVEHPIVGIITFEDVIRDLEIMLSDSELFESVVHQLLELNDMPKEDIASLYNYSVTDRLKWIIDILKSIL